MSAQPEQRSQAWVDQAAPEEIYQAMKAGELAELLAGRDPGTELSDEEIAAMTPAEILEEAKTNPALARRLPSSADQGARGPRPASVLADKSPGEISKLYRAGHLDKLLRGEA